jgi:ABC-type sulfate transport system substrate-binding protein
VEGNAAREKDGIPAAVRLKTAQDYLNHLYSPAGQRIAAKHYFRPVNPVGADPADVARFRQVEMVTVDDALFGGWASAQAKHFDEGGVFDQIYQPAR